MPAGHVPDEGPLSARVAVVGEAPGKDEMYYKRPFVGASGRLQDQWMEAAGLRRRDLYITNVLDVQPPGGGNIDNADDEDIWEAVTALHQRLDKLPNLQVIAAVGTYACYALTGHGKVKWLTTKEKRAIPGITSCRGYYYRYTTLSGRVVTVIPMLHPASLMRGNMLLEVACMADWQRVASCVDDPWPVPQRTHVIDPSEAEVAEFTQLVEEWREDLVLATDVETWGNQLNCVGFSHHPEWSITIPLEYAKQRDTFFPYIRRLLLSACPKALQNGVFDGYWFARSPHIGVFIPDHNWCYDTLFMHHALWPYEPHSLEYLVSRFVPAEYWKDEAKQGADIKKYIASLDTKEAQAQLHLYNGKDCCMTRALVDSLVAYLQHYGMWEFYLHHYRDMFAPLLSAAVVGVRVDKKLMQARYNELLEECAVIHQATTEVAGEELFAQKDFSSVKLQDYFYNKHKCVKQFAKRPGGKRSVSLNDTALRRIAMKYPGQVADVATLILRYRKNAKQSTFLNPELLDKDSRMRCSYTLNTTAGRAASSGNPMDTGCVPGDAEILTPTGWCRFDTLPAESIVMGWDAVSNKLRWTSAQLFKRSHHGVVYQAHSWFTQNTYTPEHRIPNKSPGHHNQPWRVDTAADCYTKYVSPRLVPLSGMLDSAGVSEPLVRLLVAAQADGSVEGNCIRFSFKKQRKSDRLCRLCADLGVPLSPQKAKEGYFRWSINGAIGAYLAEVLGKQKLFDARVLTWDFETLDAFVDETRFWDATQRGQSWMYFTVAKDNAEWLATAAHLTGRSATIRVNTDNNRGYGHGDNLPLYTVAVKPRMTAWDNPSSWSVQPYDGDVYCVTVPTSYFMMRYRGLITITGNCNLQNQMKDIRDIYLPDQDDWYMLKVDLSTAENRIVDAFIAVGLKQLGRVDECDFYIERANKKPWEWDQHRARAAALFGVPEVEVTKTMRADGKMVVHACQRAMKGATLSDRFLKHGVVKDEKECQALINAYHASDPCIQSVYFKWVEHEILHKHLLVNPFGRRLDFGTMRMTHDTFTKGYSFQPQCCDKQTEVLTDRGFVPFPLFDAKSDLVAQWDKDTQRISFVSAVGHCEDYEGPLYCYEGRRSSLHVTPNHRIPYHGYSDGKYRVDTAENLLNGQRVFMPCAGKYFDGHCHTAPVQLIVATQADATLRSKTVEWHFTKQRKIDRLHQLLQQAEIPYRCYNKTKDGSVIFIVYRADFASVLEWLSPVKGFTSKLLTLDADLMRLFLAELRHWDGDFAGHAYSTTDASSAEWVQIIGCLCGMRSTLRQAAVETVKHKAQWRVSLTNTSDASTSTRGIRNYRGKVFCVTVPSGFFVIRRNGKVTITGNSTIADKENTHIWLPTYRYCRESYGEWVRLQIHDEIVVTCPRDALWPIGKFIMAQCDIPIRIGDWDIVVPGELTVSRTWQGGVEFKRFPDTAEEFYARLDAEL